MYTWLTRFNADGLAGLADRPPPGSARDVHARGGRRGDCDGAHQTGGTGPAVWELDARSAEDVSARAASDRDETFAHRQDPSGRRRALAAAGEFVRRAGGPRRRRTKGRIATRYTTPSEGSAGVRRAQLGLESAKRHCGHALVRPQARERDDGRHQPAERADDGRCGNGYVVGAFRPATGETDTRPYDSRAIVNWVEFLTHVDAWVPAEFERTYAIVHNRTRCHRCAPVGDEGVSLISGRRSGISKGR